MDFKKRMDTFEGKIGYHFKNRNLLIEALTHPSVSFGSKKPEFHNQRLEYLGDSVLQLVLSEHLYHQFPDFKEGRLSQLRARLVSRDSLARCAVKLQLGKELIMSPNEEQLGGRNRISILADAMEALMAAIYLDSKLEIVSRLILKWMQDEIEQVLLQPVEKNPKGELQEILQSAANFSPRYSLVSSEGPDHNKRFSVQVEWQGHLLGVGQGQSKKEAETEAAKIALKSTLVKSILHQQKPNSK